MRAEHPVLITEVASGKKVPATLIAGVTIDEIDEAMGLWTPFRSEQERLSGRRAQHAHWEWSEKARRIHGLSSYLVLGVVAMDEMQALMLWDDLHSRAKHPSQLGKDLVYVNFLSTAPWNDRDIVEAPRFRGAGSLLVRAAVERSADLEYKGRVGLHALPQSEEFYRSRCGMADLGVDAAHESLRYFEFTPELIKAFLAKIGGTL